MKKIGLLIGFIGILLSFNTHAVCIGTGECHDIIDPSDVLSDVEIQFLLTIGGINATKEESEKYGIEQIKAYYWAYENGITTKESFKEANIEGALTRIEMAKMLSQYAINILGKNPANSIVPKYSDISSELDEAYNNGVSLSYQLGIMGIGIKEFRPFDTVTRAEFATALGRLYQINDGKDFYYSTHINVLNNKGIINNTNPDLKELRGYVMIMLMRSLSNGIDFKNQNDTAKDINKSGDNYGLKVVVNNPFFYYDTSEVYPYPTNITDIRYNAGFMIHHNGLKRGDILRICYTGNLQINTGTVAKELNNIYSIFPVGNIKDDYFKVRNNIPYEFKFSGYQDNPTIDSYISYGDFIDGNNGSSISYETGYSFTYNDLGLKISTPTGWREFFPLANPKDIFSRNGVEIRRTGKDPIAPYQVEYIKVYTKDKNQSLEDIITERHLNRGCKITSGIIVDALKGEKGIGYYITNKNENDEDKLTGLNQLARLFCFPDDEDDYSVANEAHIQFFEPANDKGRYYKIRVSSPSIFGKIETL